MANIRMMPPPSGKTPSINVNGRTYTCALGATIDVPDFDARIMLSNGWTQVALVGPTSARPATGLYMGLLYHDTTLGYVVVWEGQAWRNPNTGTAV